MAERRERGVQACRSQDLLAAETLRNLMRSLTAKHSSEQAILFGQAKGQR